MSDESEDKSSYTKYPTFDGNKDKWPFYRTKMEASLARADLGEVLPITSRGSRFVFVCV